MRIKEAIKLAIVHFIKEYQHEEQIVQLLKEYAVFELEFGDQQSFEFADSCKSIILSSVHPNQLQAYTDLFLWFYINFVVGKSNGSQTIGDAIDIALNHFLVSHFGKNTTSAIYNLYAMEELNMNRDAANNYAQQMLDEKIVPLCINSGEGRLFLTWYYITYALDN